MVYQCVVCGKPVLLDYKPEYCCDGIQCGCMGLPIEPPMCSKECGEKLYGSNCKDGACKIPIAEEKDSIAISFRVLKEENKRLKLENEKLKMMLRGNKIDF